MKLLFIVFLALTSFIKESLQRPVSKHAEIKELIKSDQCTATLNHVSIEHKMTLMGEGNISWMCCGCNPGYYVEELCKTSANVSSTKCQPCAPGTYIQEYAHGRRNCIIDSLTSCPPDKVHVPGNTREPSRCDCQWGFHSTHGGDCQLHTSCPPGEGVLIAASSFRDTTCEKCRHGYHSPNSSPTETCLPISVSFETTKNTSMAENEKATERIICNVSSKAKDRNEKENNKRYNVERESSHVSLAVFILVVVFSNVLTALVVLIATLLVLRYSKCCNKRKHDSGKNSKPLDIPRTNTEKREPDSFIQEVESPNDQQHTMSSSRGFATTSERTHKFSSTLVHQDGANEVNTEAIPLIDTPRSSGLAFQRRSQSMASSNSSSNIPNQSNEFAVDPILAVYNKIMKKMMVVISKTISEQDVHPFIREFFPGDGEEQYIEDLKNHHKRTSDKFIEAFIGLKKQGRNSFNPELIYKYLNDNNRALADEVHHLMLEWQASTRACDDSNNIACVTNNQCDSS